MNRRNVRIGAVVCSAGVVIGGITLASSAFAAPTPLTLNSGATSFTVANLGSASVPAANTSYALKIGDSTASTKLDVETAPTGGSVNYQVQATNAAAAIAATTLAAADAPVVLGGGGAIPATSNVYLSGTVPGDYTLRLFEDTNNNGSIDAADERASAVITMKVYDTVNTLIGGSSVGGDDVAPVITTPSPIDIGSAIKAGITYNKTLTLNDARGTGATGLAARLAALTFVDNTNVSGATGVANALDTPATYNPATGNITFTTTATTAAGVDRLRADLKPATGTADGGLATQFASKDVTVQTNNVASVETSTTKDANHTVDGIVRAGTATTEVSAKALDSTNGPLAGRTVTFTLASTTNSPILSVGGTVIAAAGGSGTTTAVTGSDGVAKIVVSSSVTTNGTEFTATAASNTFSDAVTVEYQTAEGTATLDKTLSAMVGAAAKVTGTVKDQFAQAYSPSNAQASITVTRGGGGTFTRTVDVVGGGFTVDVPDTATSNTTPRSDTFVIDFTPAANILQVTGGSIRYLASVAPDSITLSGLTTTGAPATTFPVPSDTVVDVTANGALDTETLTAIIKNSAGEVLQGADFSLKAGGNAYFLDQDGKAVTSFSGKTNTAGQISDDGSANGVEVFFTGGGTNAITITSGTKTASTGNFTVENPVGPAYSVELAPTVGLTNKNVLIKGKVLNAFGNGVQGVTPTLALSTTTLGSILGSVSASDSSGNFTALLLSSDATGSAEVTATIPGTTVPASAYLTTGLTRIAGEKTDKAALRIIAEGVTIQAVERRIGPGPVEVSGVAAPGSTVDVYQRPLAGGTYAKVATVTADEEGAWKKIITINSAVSVKALSGSKESTAISVAMNSKLQATAVPAGDGTVKLSVAGYPGVANSGVAIYEAKNGVLVQIGKTVRTDSRGVAKLAWKTTPGTHTIKAIYKAPGTNQGSIVLSFTVS